MEKKISDLTTFTDFDPNDLIPVVDISDSTPATKTKAYTIAQVTQSKQDTLISGTNIKTINSTSLLGSGNILINASSIGLGNVDNTSDLNKPISTATQNALDLKLNVSASALGTNPTNNLDIVLEATSDTSLTIKMKGSDGTVRSVTLTLS